MAVHEGRQQRRAARCAGVLEWVGSEAVGVGADV